MNAIDINFSIVIGYLIAVIISYLWIDDLIQWLHDRLIYEIYEKIRGEEKTINEDDEETATNKRNDNINKWKGFLNLSFGKKIGQIERFIYIFCYNV